MSPLLTFKLYAYIVLVHGMWLVHGMSLWRRAHRHLGHIRVTGAIASVAALAASLIGAVILLTAPHRPSPLWEPTGPDTRLFLDRLFWLLTAAWLLCTARFVRWTRSA